jgi:hypothetical protein
MQLLNLRKMIHRPQVKKERQGQLALYFPVKRSGPSSGAARKVGPKRFNDRW